MYQPLRRVYYDIQHTTPTPADMAIARFLSRALGNYLAISAILMLLLAFGASSILAVGVSFGVWFLLLFDMAFLTKAWGWMPTGR